MSTRDSENGAFARLACCEWVRDGKYIRMRNGFNEQVAREIRQGIGEEGSQALGLVFLGGKAMMNRAQAEALFRIEGYPLKILEPVRAM
jgi:hypothetical protein